MSEPVLSPTPLPHLGKPGGSRELMRLALPLVFSSSFLTIQLTADRMFLSESGTDALNAVLSAAMVFWTFFILLQTTANFATTFVAQYIGAGQPDRVGPVIRQSMIFSVASGLLFLGLLYFGAESFAGWMGHSESVARLEATFLKCMAFYGIPGLLVASMNSFFAGRGQSWTVLAVDAFGSIVTVFLDWVLIFGHFGFEPMGVLGAGIATVSGACAAATLAAVLLFRPRHIREFGLLKGPLFEAKLFNRLMRFGLPSGVQWMLDGAAFTMFVIMLGWFGDAAFGASSITFTINAMLFIPMLGLGQAVSILVGQRLGGDMPDVAQKSVWTGMKIATIYMIGTAAVYLSIPMTLAAMFKPLEGADSAKYLAAAEMVPTLLWFVAFYSLFDAAYIIFSFALRGAGDTKFVSQVALVSSWPIMVLPTYLAYRNGWDVTWGWAFASAYVLFVATVLLLRFRHGKWKSMRVIEQVPKLEDPATEPEPVTA